MVLSANERLTVWSVLIIGACTLCAMIAYMLRERRRRPSSLKTEELLPHACGSRGGRILETRAVLCEFETHLEPRVIFDGIYCTACMLELACPCGATPMRGTEHVSTPRQTLEWLTCCGRHANAWRIRRQVAQRVHPTERKPAFRVNVPVARSGGRANVRYLN